MQTKSIRAHSSRIPAIAVTLAMTLIAMSPQFASAAEQVDWPVYGGSTDELHFSPLVQITPANINGLGLVWFHDLPQTFSALSEPVEADGMVFAAYGLGLVDAMDAVTGKQLWRYDPKTAEAAGDKLRHAWATRGLGFWNGKVYVGTQDGRLIALDAKSGKLLWSVKTTGENDGRYIASPPRLFDGKVIIGHGGADQAPIRGYVTAYDATTGKQLWRFYTVPGNPADGFENDAMKMAAKTWSGKWWEYGGGGNVWHAMTYDAKYKRIYLGTGNGQPWNRKIRSKGQGDNLFLSSIVALDAQTGEYQWHYQTTPGESWDYNSSMDIELTTLRIDGKQRDVLMHAPKNGFFYVIDRSSGKLLSADKIGKVTWAERVDLITGRPVEAANIRYESGETVIWPGPSGVHNWIPMAFNPNTGLVYIPTQSSPARFTDKDIDLAGWRAEPRGKSNPGVRLGGGIAPELREGEGNWLIAWDPIAKRNAWRVSVPGNAGVLTTAGGLVFQGRADGRLIAYAGDSGKPVWDFDARVGIIGAPISFIRDGIQYVTLIGGYGGNQAEGGYGWDYREQKRRVLTFALNGKTVLPSGGPVKVTVARDPAEQVDPKLAKRGSEVFGEWCRRCHGGGAIANGTAPDLRASAVPLSSDAFATVVRGGALLLRGMPRYDEFSTEDVEAIRHFIRSRAQAVMAENKAQ